jgi:formylglycine-generating enzyme required for sulfatase activity
VNAAERLADVLAVLCRRPSSNRQKVLIVIDQFEQWLHGHGQEMDISELLFALRQPDGESVAVLLLVRDDFWMGTSRVFEKLYINLDPDRNTRAVDLFDIDHAQYVLRRFGQAFGKLPDAAAAETEDQRQFLNQAVHELSENGRVISVRLSLFADLMKDRPWTLRSLFDMGGAAGVGLRFLEETFGSRSAVPERRALEKSARALLGSLLPETGTDIKAHVRADAQLAADCELPKGSRRFTRLLHILDHDLHLITPTETEQGNYYQLTHDYLIPQIEQWITFERRKSWRGRAKLCLEERTRQMQRWPQSRYVPSIVEYLSILLAVPRKRRRPEQQVLMRESAQVHGLRWGSTLAAMLVLVLGAFLYIAFNRRESRGQAMESIVANVLSASPDGLQYVLKSLQSEPDLAVPLLAHAFTQAAPNSRDGLHAAFALRFLGRGRELTVQQYLADSIASATPGECNNFITFLHPLTKSMRELLTDRFAAASDPEVKARFAIVLLHLGVSQPAELMLNGTDQVMLRTTFIHTFVDWHADLQTLRRSVSRSIILKDVDSLASLRSGLCSAVGLLKERPVGAEYTFLRDWLQWMFLSAPDGGTHSAADWALRQLGATVPYDRLTEATSEGQKRRWYTLSFDMTPEPIRITAVEVRPGKVTVPNLSDPEQPPTLISIDQPFFMLDREVWVDLFNAYYHDPDCPDSEKPEAWPGANPSYSPFGDCPVQSVSWYDAILFCNWLSGKLGRTKCYRRSGEKESMPHPKEPGQTCDVDVWEIVPGANGFRLPKDAEWILACQAGNTGLFCFGDDPHYLSDFASFASRRFTTSRGAEHLPNLFGLFDMHGNVHEWCWDTHLFQPRSPRVNPSRRAARGGSFQLPAPACASNQAVTLSPVGRSGVNGFRVVFAP